MRTTLLTLRLGGDDDVVLARQRAREIARALGFGPQDQIRIATAVSELARNVVRYARVGSAEFALVVDGPSRLEIHVRDQGPGIAELGEVLEGRYRSTTGMGLGLVGTRRLMDEFAVHSTVGLGTEVRIAKYLPATAGEPTRATLAQLGRELAGQRRDSAVEELSQQNRELVQALGALAAREADLARREAELARVNGELEETNRGVVALYAELEAQAEALRRASDAKSAFLSNLTHEFRTPLNSVLSLSRLLLERVDGPLGEEQEKQVTFIQRSAEALSEMINDLLDIAKIEAGRTEARPQPFPLDGLLSALRGTMRPLAASDAVTLTVDSVPDLPRLFTDEAKLGQVLRNLVSNALKYTERGEVRVGAARAGPGSVRITVRDTGLGIAPEHHLRIFEEFAQVEGAHQRRVKGTGLGLPLARKLAVLLGGTLELERSLPGEGSTFVVTLPAILPAPAGSSAAAPPPEVPADIAQAWGRARVVLLDPDPGQAAALAELLGGMGQPVQRAETVDQARRALAEGAQAALLVLRGEDEPGWDLLSELRTRAGPRLPVVVITEELHHNRALALGADAFHAPPPPAGWLRTTLDALGGGERAQPEPAGVLLIDDDAVARYLLRRLLLPFGLPVLEAADGREGLLRARAEQPRLIFLDLRMPGLSGFEVLEALAGDPRTAAIPVVVSSSAALDAAEQARLGPAAAVLPKSALDAAAVNAVVARLLGKALLPGPHRAGGDGTPRGG